ncbi:MAG TPA: PspC domain-containing protein [Amycolatopsis sp.]|uniref:PspC domain-containing protein n=1 Tax=Amycolatopsis sp. TaxID=37632 RepID=UPI002B472CD7|nr:PspC domain-containing protein [Amycolatopsis sp.]HKS49442.1 PspC domain-containing protein [Amycolatopsis sp.]
MSGATEAPRSHLAGFEETVKDFWVSRPRRPLHGRKIAGVAAGIGNRYGIDPVVVRVAFVTATIFGGIGLSLYLLGWLLFPGENDEVSPVEALFGQGRTSMSKAFTIMLAIAFFPIASWAFAGGGWFDGGAVIGLALMATALYLLHRGRGQDNRPPAVATGAAAAFSLSAETAAERASGWDPLAAAPLGWDLPEPAPAPTPPPPPAPTPARRRNRKVGPATFGIALLVSGAGAALGTSGIEWFSPPHIIGLALGVLGVGMVVGSFVRGGRGLIGWAVPLSIAGLVMTAVPVRDYVGGFGELDASPLTAAEVLPVYQHSAGDIELDLSRLPAGTPVATTVHNGAGTTTVLVPETADVQYSCEVRAGNVDCLGHQTDGVNVPATAGTDLGLDGPGGPQITLTVTNGLGNVEVRRG